MSGASNWTGPVAADAEADRRDRVLYEARQQSGRAILAAIAYVLGSGALALHLGDGMLEALVLALALVGMCMGVAQNVAGNVRRERLVDEERRR